jgi:stage V sporulation protein R
MPDQRYLDELAEAIERLWGLAHEFGLRPFPTHFEIVPAAIMYEFGAYGMPGRFSHWTHGRAFQQMKTMYDYGLSKIYELVINTNPSYAYLLDVNSVLQNKFVAAHVLGHTDFFANNAHFARTSRRMVETMNRNAERIAGYAYTHGSREVERVLDATLALEEHLDPYADPAEYEPRRREPDKRSPPAPGPFDDLWDLGERETRRAGARREEERRAPGPYQDLLLFLLHHAPRLEDWERDIVAIVREEMLYFLPQMRTKIANEGWAVFWHLRLMRALDLSPQEYVDFANMHSGVLQPARRSINPYYVGHGILEDINRRHGGDETTVAPIMFEIRERESDVSLVRNYLTKELVADLDLYLYEQREDELVVVEKDFETIRDALVDSLVNHGHPRIVVADGDYAGNRELYLRHEWEGQGLDLAHAEKALEHVQRLWGRRVHLETRARNARRGEPAPLVLSYDPREGHSKRGG